MIEVEFGDRIVEFPDDMSENAITSALHQIETQYVKINPYEAEKLKPGYRPMTTLGPTNPEEVLSYADILKIPAAVVEPIMSDVESITADVLNRTGLNPSARPGIPMVNVPQIPNLTAGGRLLKVVAPDLATGLEKGLGEFVSGFSTPGQAATVPLVGGKLVQTLFALQAAGATPDSIKAIADAKTAEDQGKAIAQAAANVGMAYMLGKGLVAGETVPKVLTPPPSKTPPGFPRRVLQMPPGSRAPRPEPVAAPEKLSPEQAAIQAERMSQEATAAVEPVVAPPVEEAVTPPVESAPAKTLQTAAEFPSIGTAVKIAEKVDPENIGSLMQAFRQAHSAGYEGMDAMRAAWSLYAASAENPKIKSFNEFKNSYAASLEAQMRVVHNDLREASAGTKALAVGEAEKLGPTTRSGPPSAKAEEGARETAILPSKTEPKPSPVESGTAEPGTVPPAAAVGEVSATPGAVAPAQPPAISQATTPTKGKQTGALELPKLEKANVKADPRLSTPGITKKSKPNSLVIQLRDLESNPIREITVESSGDPLTDSKIVGDTINKNATNPNVSIRESLGVSTGPNGRAIYQFGMSPNGMTWVEAGKLIEARKQRVAIENPKAAPLPPLEMGTSYPYLNTIVVAIKLSPDGKRVQVRDLKSSTGKKEWVPVNKLNTARFLARADAIDRGIGAQPSPAPEAKPAETKVEQDVGQPLWHELTGAQKQEQIDRAKSLTVKQAVKEVDEGKLDVNALTPEQWNAVRQEATEAIMSAGEEEPSIPQGPGARTYQPEREAQTPESFSGTSLQKAVGELEAASYGFAPPDPAKSKPEAIEWIRAGMTLAKDPLAGERLIAELISNPDRRVTDAEAAVLLRQKVLIENDMNRAAEQSVTATDPQAKAAAQTRFDTLSNQLLDLLNVAKSQGREWGRLGRWYQMFAAEDMSLSTLITNRRAKLGRELNPAEVAELKAFADRNKELVARLEKRNAELQAERDAAEAKQIAAQAEIDAKMAKMPSGYVVKIAEEIVASWDKRADAARARLREKMARTSAGVDPTIVLDVAEIGLSHLGHIGLDFVKWADAVKRDIGDWAEPYLKAAWEKTKTLADEEINLRKGKAKATEIKKAIGPKISVLTKVQQKYAKRIERAEPVGDIHWDARKIARYFWLNGIREPMALVDAVHEVFKQFVPDMTKRQVMDALGGYGKYRMLPKDAVSVGLRDAYGQLQQISKLDDMAHGIAPKRSGFEQRVKSDAERHLVKQVEEAKKRGGYDITDPATQLRTAMQAAERRLTNQINDLQHEIDTRTKIVRNKTKLVFDDKLNALKARRDALKEIHDEVFKPAPLTEAERLAIWKEKAREWIETWKERLELKDVHPKPRPDPIRLDPEAISIRREQQKVRHAVLEMRIKDQLKQRTTQRKIADSIGNTIVFLRAAMAGMEFSAVFKQGATGVFGRPITTARALKKMFQAFSSEDKQFAIMDEIFTRENAPLYERGKLQFTESGVRLSTMEEMYMFRFAEWMKRVPVLRHYIKTMDAFQRAFTTFLNVMRADTMDAMIKENGTDPKTLIDIANTINVFTGRGSASLNRLGAVPNQVFFAPRWAISRFQLLLGQPLWSASKGNRMMVAKEYGRVLLGLGAFYALAYAAGGKVDWNPVSSEFGKIKLGDRVIDPLFGLAPVMRLIAQSVSGLRKNSKGNIRPTREKEFIPKPFRGMVQGSFKRGPYEPSGTELIGRFAWSKLAPAPETFVSAAGGQNVVGEPVTLSGKAVQLITPITYNDIFSALKEDGVSPSTAIDLMAIFGLSSYVKKEQ